VIATVSPVSGETLATFDAHSADEIEQRLSSAARAAADWRLTSIEHRAALLSRLAAQLESEKAAFGRLMTLEMGKTLASAIAEAEKCASACTYYAEHGAGFLAPETVSDDPRSEGRVVFQPLGVVLAVMPWNFPFWQVMRFAAPALLAGNAAVLKHASNVPQCALALERLFIEAGAPSGLFQALLVGSDAVAALIGDPRVHAVTLTGSEGAGRSVAAAAGRHLKKAVLELGGSDPFIVLASADVEQAARTAVTARCINNGQSCIAAKRFIVVEPVADEFTKRFVAGMEALRVGDPLEPGTDLGPLATRAIRDEVHGQVTATVGAGARVLCGGGPLPGPGNYYQPTVITDVPRGSPAWADEIFGPVAALFRVPDPGAALALANDTAFGLGASVWTRDENEAAHFARDLEAGSVFINAMVASDPRYPFGGVKASGYGRELGVFGLHEFVNIKTVRGTAR
jgi:succinate-semialdehyde dehydrogenase / glutarate-semialdehyde dehydrogenase